MGLWKSLFGERGPSKCEVIPDSKPEDRVALVKAASNAVDDLVSVSTRVSYGDRPDLVAAIRGYGVYAVPRLCMYATDPNSVGNQLIGFGVLALLDPKGKGLRLAVAAYRNPDPMVQHYSKYCAGAVFLGLKEGKVPDLHQIVLSDEERQTLTHMLEELCNSDREHQRLRQMTRDVLEFGQRVGLAR